MSEEYKNFNDYGKAPEENPTADRAPGHGDGTPSPDPNPPTGWAPGFSEENSTTVSSSSSQGILSIILSLAGFCSGPISFIGIFVALGAYRRNKFDVTAKVGLVACILMTVLWLATIAFYLFTPTGRAMYAEMMQETQRMIDEMFSGSDIYSFFR